jgi:hypothetical protein
MGSLDGQENIKITERVRRASENSRYRDINVYGIVAVYGSKQQKNSNTGFLKWA